MLIRSAARLTSSLGRSNDICFSVSRMSSIRPWADSGRTRLLQHYSTQQASASAIKKCQFCGSTSPVSAATCQSCHSPCPIPDSVSYYDHFPDIDAPPVGAFEIDTRHLRKEFLKLQQRVHPDKFSHDEKKRQIAEGTSSLLNKAYTTLQQPLSRAEYLLELQGQESAGEGDKLTDNKVLMTVMGAQEAVEEAQSEDDLIQVKAEAKDLIKSEIQTLSEVFAKEDYERARESAVKLRYWLNIQKSAQEWSSPS